MLVCLSAFFVYAHASHVLEHKSLTGVFFAAEQGLLVAMFLTRRRTHTTSQRPLDWVVAAVGSWLSLAMRPHETSGLGADIGTVIQLLGLTFVIVSFLTIGKSFGIVAANRGLKVNGPYRLVRHPIYLGHSITLGGFLLANLWWPNILIFMTVTVFQLLRIRAEERVLSETADYASYASTVRWRLVPGLY